MSARAARHGASLVEALVALLTGLLLAQLSLSVFARARSAQRSLVEGAEALTALRIGRHVLRSELRVGVAGRDWVPQDGDSLALRAFRGLGLVCPDRPSPTELLVAYGGLRAPDPDKDSLLLLDGDGVWHRGRLTAVGSGDLECAAAPGTAVRAWTLQEEPAAPIVLARVFERGSYHVSGGALRYRRGDGGRQPLTPQVLDTRLSRFARSPTGLALELFTAPAFRRPWRGLLAPLP